MLDQYRISRGFARAAAGFDVHDFLHREIRERLLERLQAFRMEPQVVADIGAGTGGALPALQQRFPAATLLPIDLTAAMLRASNADIRGVCADAARLPLPEAAVDLVFSNLMLHHCPDPTATLSEMLRVLRIPGVLLFTTFGPNTLSELGRAWATADRYSHIVPFPDMHDVGDMLVQAGFAEPVIDSQTLTITYGDVDKLIADLRQAGSTNATAGRNQGLTGRSAGERFRLACAAQADDNGRIPLTIDVIFGVAWTSESARQRGPVEIPLDRIARRRPDDG